MVCVGESQMAVKSDIVKLYKLVIKTLTQVLEMVGQIDMNPLDVKISQLIELL